MLKNLLIDGIKFNLWKPNSETRDFAPIIREHSKEIFGGNSLYFDIKPELRSSVGIGSKPDGFVIDFSKPAFYVVEVEKAEHGLHDHVYPRISKFNDAMNRSETRAKIIQALYEDIKGDSHKDYFVESRIREDLYKFITDLVTPSPHIVIIIDEFQDELEAVEESLKLEIIVFQTFTRKDAPTVHAHLYDALTQHGKSILFTPGTSLPSITAQERGKRYLSFYQELADRLKEKVPSAVAEPKSLRYCKIQSAIGGVHFEWLFGGNPRTRFGVELHFARARVANLKLIREFEKYKKEIETVTGEKVIFQENWKSLSSRLYLEKNEGEMTEELKIWAVEKMALLYNLLQPKLEALK